MIDRVKIDAMNYNELTHADLSDCIEYDTYNQVLILSSIKSTHQEEKKVLVIEKKVPCCYFKGGY
jgi:hypothetical protein